MTKVSSEEIRRAALNTMKQLFRAMKEDANFKVAISEHDEDALINKTVQHHGEHLKLHALWQRHVDGYKLLAWLGCNLLDLIKDNSEDVDGDFQFKECARILVNLMSGFLETDHGIEMPLSTRKMMAISLYQERFNNADHGIWMNGLFLSFHSAVRACELKSE
jgi:hypothetical protein